MYMYLVQYTCTLYIFAFFADTPCNSIQKLCSDGSCVLSWLDCRKFERNQSYPMYSGWKKSLALSMLSVMQINVTVAHGYTFYV